MYKTVWTMFIWKWDTETLIKIYSTIIHKILKALHGLFIDRKYPLRQPPMIERPKWLWFNNTCVYIGNKETFVFSIMSDIQKMDLRRSYKFRVHWRIRCTVVDIGSENLALQWLPPPPLPFSYRWEPQQNFWINYLISRIFITSHA